MDPITSKEDFKYYEGKLYFQEKDYKKAIKIYREGLKVNPQSAILLYEIGMAYCRLKNYHMASKYWKKLLKITSSDS
jgi:tetratricopeptide (TPR) repeat protein